MEINLQLRAALELLPVSTFTATADGRIDWVSDRWYEETGVARGTALGEAWVHVVHPDDIEDVVWQWTQALDSGCACEVTSRVKHADGMYRWYFTRAERITHTSGSTMWIGTTVDLSLVPWKRMAEIERHDADVAHADPRP